MSQQRKSYCKFVATATAAALVASSMAPVVSQAASFKDVPDRCKEAVDFVVSKGVQGFNETTYGTNEFIKRVDAAVMLAKVLEMDVESAPASGFKDVPQRAVKYVNALKEAGITNGKTETNFGSNDLITRGELAIWIQRAFDLPSSVSMDFKDVAPRYKSAVSALLKAEITNGVSATEFGTTQNAKRGDFAIFLYRAANVTPQ